MEIGAVAAHVDAIGEILMVDGVDELCSKYASAKKSAKKTGLLLALCARCMEAAPAAVKLLVTEETGKPAEEVEAMSQTELMNNSVSVVQAIFTPFLKAASEGEK